MSFLQGIVDFAKAAYTLVSGNTIGAALVKTAVVGYTLNKITKSINKENAESEPVDQGVRIQVSPSTTHKIPVLYGTAYFGGIVTDAVMTNNNKTMFYCITLCEKTGTLLSTGQASEFTFKDVYWNDQRIVFRPDGITAHYTVDRNGFIDPSIADQVKIWCYKGNSSLPATVENYATPNTALAYNVMPGWAEGTHPMSDLVFAIVQVDYNRDKNITGLGNLVFQVDNSMRLPGDCLNDYMTNNRYGAGIDPQEIYTL